MLRKAIDIADGTAVVSRREGQAPAVFLKTSRHGKDFHHHYLVMLHPWPDCPGLIYIDPEDEVFDLGHGIDFIPGALESGGQPALGAVFRNARGFFLKLRDTERAQKSFAYIDIASAAVLRRQERGVVGVCTTWQARGDAAGNGLELAELLARAVAEIEA